MKSAESSQSSSLRCRVTTSEAFLLCVCVYISRKDLGLMLKSYKCVCLVQRTPGEGERNP